MDSSEHPSCTVLGAGISGLLAASIFKKHKVEVKVLEKARGVGGRMSTRRMSGARFDHGAQFFTVRETIFGGWVAAWENSGVIREWFRRFEEESSESGHPRYRGGEGMNAVCKHLAEDLDVSCQTRVVEAKFENRRWRLTSDDGQEFASRFLISSLPAPQMLELLKHSSGVNLRSNDMKALEAVDYERSLALLLILDRPSAIPDFGGTKLHHHPVLTWAADNEKKGISKVPAITLHSTNAFACEHWDSPDEVRVPLMLEAAQELIGSAKVMESQIHRWRYTRPIKPFDGQFFFDREHNLLLCGDSFGGPRVEGAAISGIEAAAHLLDFL